MLGKILTKSFKIFTLFDIPVYLHSTWLIMLLVIALFSPPTALLFVAAYTFVLMHEFGHCLAAKWCDLEVVSITMLPFGGIAGIADLKGDPKKELLVTFAGPFVNAALVSFFSLPLLAMGSLPVWLATIVMVGWWINVMLFIFNMIPCFPMDGGRILRAILTLYWGDLIKATRVAVLVGRVFACGFIALGLWFFQIMWIVIGVVIMYLAEMEYRMLKQSVHMGDLADQLHDLDES
jgi:Zn-dependent protease